MKRTTKKLAALAMVGGLIAIAVLALVLYSSGFTATVPVTVISQRAGLVLDADAKVQMRGVVIGRVASIEQDERGAVLHLDIEESRVESIPSNSTVDIESTTVFGAKYVNFVPPQQPSTETIAAGAVFDSDSVTVEINTVFENLSSVLQTIQPQKLNETLGAIAAGFQGRGNDVGDLIRTSDAYLSRINDSLPDLSRDLRSTAAVTDLYAEVSPSLLKILENGTAISDTVVSEQDNLDALLLDVTGLGNVGADVLDENNPAAATVLGQLRPTLDLAAEYSPELPCTLGGFAYGSEIGTPVYSGQPGIKLSVGLLPGVPTYTVQDNLPKNGATGGPNCFDLPRPAADGENAKYLVTDTGANPLNPLVTSPRINFDSFLGILYGTPFVPGAP
jgi:phospholipid/cholesterol/gamma-HCH transport system substrate-binding protein